MQSNMVSSWVYLFLWCTLYSGVLAAPIDEDPELTDGYFEGDIILDVERNGLLNPLRQWPNKTVFYKISDEFDPSFVAVIEQAMRGIEACSCILFVPAVNETEYVFINVSSAGCNSQMGYVAGAMRTMNLKPVTVGLGCFQITVVQHELFHVLGFTHQQNSPDRDKYVKIVEKNIIVGKESSFAKRSEANFGNFGQNYDYGSMMHYKQFAFSSNGNPTIKALNSAYQNLMGQREKMSDVDIKRLNTMYKCPS